MAEIISREEAEAQGQARFFTGIACPLGHFAERYISGGNCSECARIQNRAYVTKRRASDPAYAAYRDGLSRKWAKDNPAKAKAAQDRHENRPERQARKRITTSEWRKQHPEKISEQNKRWRAKNPDYQKGETRKKWIAENRDLLRALQRSHRAKDPQKARDAVKTWSLRNPDRAKQVRDASRTNRRTKEKANGGHATGDDIAALYIKQDGKCLTCGSTHRLEIDHIVAVAKGGSSDPSNLQLLCRTCNASKGDRDMIEWMHERFPQFC